MKNDSILSIRRKKSNEDSNETDNTSSEYLDDEDEEIDSVTQREEDVSNTDSYCDSDEEEDLENYFYYYETESDDPVDASELDILSRHRKAEPSKNSMAASRKSPSKQPRTELNSSLQKQQYKSSFDHQLSSSNSRHSGDVKSSPSNFNDTMQRRRSFVHDEQQSNEGQENAQKEEMLSQKNRNSIVSNRSDKIDTKNGNSRKSAPSSGAEASSAQVEREEEESLADAKTNRDSTKSKDGGAQPHDLVEVSEESSLTNEDKKEENLNSSDVNIPTAFAEFLSSKNVHKFEDFWWKESEEDSSRKKTDSGRDIITVSEESLMDAFNQLSSQQKGDNESLSPSINVKVPPFSSWITTPHPERETRGMDLEDVISSFQRLNDEFSALAIRKKSELDQQKEIVGMKNEESALLRSIEDELRRAMDSAEKRLKDEELNYERAVQDFKEGKIDIEDEMTRIKLALMKLKMEREVLRSKINELVDARARRRAERSRLLMLAKGHALELSDAFVTDEIEGLTSNPLTQWATKNDFEFEKMKRIREMEKCPQSSVGEPENRTADDVTKAEEQAENPLDSQFSSTEEDTQAADALSKLKKKKKKKTGAAFITLAHIPDRPLPVVLDEAEYQSRMLITPNTSSSAITSQQQVDNQLRLSSVSSSQSVLDRSHAATPSNGNLTFSSLATTFKQTNTLPPQRAPPIPKLTPEVIEEEWIRYKAEQGERKIKKIKKQQQLQQMQQLQQLNSLNNLASATLTDQDHEWFESIDDVLWQKRAENPSTEKLFKKDAFGRNGTLLSPVGSRLLSPLSKKRTKNEIAEEPLPKGLFKTLKNIDSAPINLIAEEDPNLSFSADESVLIDKISPRFALDEKEKKAEEEFKSVNPLEVGVQLPALLSNSRSASLANLHLPSLIASASKKTIRTHPVFHSALPPPVALNQNRAVDFTRLNPPGNDDPAWLMTKRRTHGGFSPPRQKKQPCELVEEAELFKNEKKKKTESVRNGKDETASLCSSNSNDNSSRPASFGGTGLTKRDANKPVLKGESLFAVWASRRNLLATNESLPQSDVLKKKTN
eukprot:GDKJ01046271.1.p1 GENE.GDKJ01046271.1~~GDKJ01046271.1.p1  ORF type:complete len:1091 (-),score=372.22 GDKJ01046271.1:33-3212(-)